MDSAPLPERRVLSRRYVLALAVVVSIAAVGLLAGGWRMGALSARMFTVPGPTVVDLNKDDAATIALLPGVGAELAQKIVASREAYGAFKSQDDLLRVDGMSVGQVKWMMPHVAMVRDEGWLGK